MLAAVFISFAHINNGCFACLHTARGIARSDGGGARITACGWNDGAGRHGVYESRQESMVPGNVGIAAREGGLARIVRGAGNPVNPVNSVHRMNLMRARHGAGSIRLTHGSKVRTTGRSTAGDRGACDSLRSDVACGGLALDA